MDVRKLRTKPDAIHFVNAQPVTGFFWKLASLKSASVRDSTISTDKSE